MSEQLANLYSTTLASSYTAGSGSISVTSATGAPGSGTFSLTILDASTGNVILIFRVTSVSGTTFSGAAEGPDSNAASASVVVGTILTAAAITQLFTDHPGGFIQPVTAPVAADFTALNFNVGTGVVTTQSNNSSPVTSISLMQADPNTTDEIVALAKSKIASTFTVTIGFSAIAWQPSAQGLCGLWLSDGGSPPNNIFLCLQLGEGYRIPLFSSFTSFSSDVLTSGPGTVNTFPFPVGPLIWMRIQETGSARNYYVSPDGILWIQIWTESNTAHFTTAQYGFGCENRSSPGTIAMCVYSFSETNP